MKEVIGWGILGTGNIATSFATGVATMPDAKLMAVGSVAGTDDLGDASAHSWLGGIGPNMGG